MARTKLDEDRDVLEAITRKLLDRLRGDMDWLKEHGVGVTVFAFTFEPGAIAYISTGAREDMIRALKEFIAMQEAGLTTDPPGERGRV